MNDVKESIAEADTVPVADDRSDAKPSRPLVRVFGLALTIVSVALATYLVVAYLGWESGRRQTNGLQATTRAEQVNRQIELARENLSEGSTQLARTRLQWVLEQDPGNLEATRLQGEIDAAEAAVNRPTEAPAPPTVPAATAEATQASNGELGTQLQTIRDLVNTGAWDAALSQLLSFQQQYPDYERSETDRLLYDTYVNLGLDHVNTDKIEVGLYYFSQAERLGALPQQAQDYRLWADLYFTGISYFGVNWEIATGYFRDLCAAAPFFQSSCSRLQRALEGYGDQLSYQQDWCPAVSVFEEALRGDSSAELSAKLEQAREGCANATPVPLTSTVPLSDTELLMPLEPGE